MTRMARSKVASPFQICVLICALSLLAGSASAARSGRSLLKGGPTPTPRPTARTPATTTTTTTTAAPTPAKAAATPTAATPTAATTAATSSSGSGSGSPATTTTAAGRWNPLVSPSGDKCTLAKTGQPVEVNGYPSSPFDTTPLVFKRPYRHLVTLEDSIKTTKGEAPCDKNNRCMKGFNINIAQTWFDFGLAEDTQCKKIPVLSYNDVGVPGPLMISQTGVQDVVRFTNSIEDNNRYFPPGGPANRGGEGEKDLCANRLERYQQRNSTGRVDEVKTPGRGRAAVTHFHGEASVASMDGWADQFFCLGETKDYIIPNNRHATLFYHDHSVGITSENVYAGMAGMRIVRPCPGDDPYNVEGLPEWPLLIQDMVVDTPVAGDPAGVCRLKYDRKEGGVHHDQLWGDINLVNGHVWPYLNVTAAWQRFRILNAAISRPRILMLRDDAGKEIGSKMCNIVGADGGSLPYARDHPWPSYGLLTDVAYRWDVVCDFSAYTGRAVYLTDEHQPDRTTSETPFFCYSHLVMKINVGAVDPAAPKPNLDAPRTAGTDQQDAQLPPAYFDQLMQRAMNGESDRSLKFSKSSGMWLFNDRGWDHEDNLGKGKHIEFNNIGQNTVELWTLESGGGWIHPVHVHLVDFFCMAWQGADWDGAASSSGGGWKPCPSELRYAPKDVMHIGANVGRITLAARYGPELGEYMVHCHNNVHEDNDMFRAFMIRDALGGFTYSKTPAFNYTSLQESPLTFTDAYGDGRNTTYSADTVAAPAFDTKYARELLSRRYYEVFFPRQGTYLDSADHNMWLTSCGKGKFNAADDPPAAGRRRMLRLERSKENWRTAACAGLLGMFWQW